MAEKTVLITGCSSRIGNATARAFRKDGWTVYATAPGVDDLDDLADIECATAELDVTNDEQVEAVIERILDERSRIDCLINNAGYGQVGPLEELSTDRLLDQFEVNTFGPHRLVRAALPAMRRQGSGTIINVSSVYGRTTMPGQGAYSGSKWALEGMSGALRTELSDHGVDVVLIEPGPVKTEFGERAQREMENLERTGAYEWFYTLYSDRRAIDRSPDAIESEDVAGVMLEAANSDDPDARYRPGLRGTLLPLSHLLPAKVWNRVFDRIKRLLEWI